MEACRLSWVEVEGCAGSRLPNLFDLAQLLDVLGGDVVAVAWGGHGG